jgi:hypothetical protein
MRHTDGFQGGEGERHVTTDRAAVRPRCSEGRLINVGEHDWPKVCRHVGRVWHVQHLLGYDEGKDVMARFRTRAALLAVVGALAACAVPVAPGAGTASDVATAERGREAPTADCRPAPDAAQPQYIIGYGSLMQDESRKRTSPQAGPAHPVQVSGFRRGWYAQGDPVGFSTTFLGVVPDAQRHFNAVIYRVEPSELAATDRREASYCRVHVPFTAIQALSRDAAHAAGGQAWIYANTPEAIATPSARFPIVQSYVDIFVSGCLEQEQRFDLKGYAQQCLTTTQEWSAHWVNDRLHPRRPFIHQPKARQIDALLQRELPAYFSRIRIE